MTATADRPASKKRKRDEGHVLKIGNKTISLDGFFNPPQKAAQKESKSEPSVKDETRQSIHEGEAPSSAKQGRRRKQKPSEAAEEKGDRTLLPMRKALPIWGYRDAIRGQLREHDVLILVGETGSGKSTQVPQLLADEKWCRRRTVTVSNPAGDDGGLRTEQRAVGGCIAVTQPRRVAATTLAYRVAKEAGTPLVGSFSGAAAGATKHGQKSQQQQQPQGLVGYSVRFDHNVPKGTKIKYLTEGMLLQELLRDPGLRQYSAVVVDEVHERSIDVDLLCGFLKQILLSVNYAARGGVPLKVVVMSATANIETMQRFFSSDGSTSGSSDSNFPSPSQKQFEPQLLSIEGRQFPVDIIYTAKPVPDLRDEVLKTVFKIHCGEPLPGDILVFLTGQEDIEVLQRLIEEYAGTLASDVPKIQAFPLFGQLSIEAQHHAFRPLKGRVRKVVLATNIAETSVTVPGVRFVVDTGKAKVKQFRPRLGLESLLVTPISKSSAIQRAGRAGREAPGKCYRLYTEEAFGELQETDPPEILRNDVLGAVLTMKARGVEDVTAFPLMDTPKAASLEKALLHLHFLGALDDSFTITDLGRKMAAFPVSAPFGRVLLAAADPRFDCLLEAIDVISCISAGDDIFHQVQSEEVREEVEALRRELYRREGDLLTYLTTMRLYTAERGDRTRWCRERRVNLRTMRQALNIRRQLRALCLAEKLLRDRPEPDPVPFEAPTPDRAESLIRCFMKGFANRTAMLAPDGSYITTSGGKHVVAIHPASVLHGQKREAIMFLEHVFTQKNYAKKVSVVQAVWIAEIMEERW